MCNFLLCQLPYCNIIVYFLLFISFIVYFFYSCNLGKKLKKNIMFIIFIMTTLNSHGGKMYAYLFNFYSQLSFSTWFVYNNARLGSSHSVCVLRNCCCSKVRNILGNAYEGSHFLIQTEYLILYIKGAHLQTHLSKN